MPSPGPLPQTNEDGVASIFHGWGFPEGASFSCPISICKHVGEAVVDSLCAEMHELPASSFLVCPRFLGSHQWFSRHRFPSPVELQELCRYTSESASVARLAPCPIGRPSLPARYALGVGERCGEWPANQWHTTPPLRLRPHQRLLPSSSACRMCRFASFSRVKHLREVGPLSRPVMWSMRLTQPVSTPLQSSLRFLPDLLSAPPSVHLAMYVPPVTGERYGFILFRWIDTIG